MGITIDVLGLDGVLEALDRLTPGELMDAAAVGLKKGIESVRADAQANAPVDTGELREKIKTRVTVRSGALVGEVVAYAPHSIYVEMGTGPKGESSHAGVNPEWMEGLTYRPNGWTYPTKDGGFRFTRGMPARPFLYPAYKAGEGKCRDLIAAAIIRHVQGG